MDNDNTECFQAFSLRNLSKRKPLPTWRKTFAAVIFVIPVSPLFFILLYPPITRTSPQDAVKEVVYVVLTPVGRIAFYLAIASALMLGYAELMRRYGRPG